MDEHSLTMLCALATIQNIVYVSTYYVGYTHTRFLHSDHCQAGWKPAVIRVNPFSAKLFY